MLALSDREPGAAADGGGMSGFPRFIASALTAAAEVGRSAERRVRKCIQFA